MVKFGEVVGVLVKGGEDIVGVVGSLGNGRRGTHRAI